MFKTALTLATIYFCLLLAGCGGGGSNMTTAAAGTQVAGDSGNSGIQQAAANPTLTSSLVADPTQARFIAPYALKFTENGDLYLADGRMTVRKIAKNGAVTTVAGAPGVTGNVDGAGADARFTWIKSLAVDDSGEIYLVDGDVVRKVTASGVVSTIAGMQGTLGNVDGAGSIARFHVPQGIAVDCVCNLYVADSFNFTIRKIGSDGIVSTFVGGDTTGNTSLHDGIGTQAQFVGPTAIAIDSANNLYISDVAIYPTKVPKVESGSTFIRKVSPDGVVTTLAGTFGYTAGPIAPTSILIPPQLTDVYSIAVDAVGNVYAIDHWNNGSSIKKISPDGKITTLATSAPRSYWSALAIDPVGDLYIAADMAIYKVSQSGELTLYAGKPNEPGSADTPQH
jgi:hypothetical protein